MSDWSVNTPQAQKAAQEVEASAAKLGKYAESYESARAALLASWEGSRKDLFEKATANGFQQTAVELSKSFTQLSGMMESTVRQMVLKDTQAADTMKD